MRTIELSVFKYAELDDKAKAKARDWYRECDTQDWAPELDDALTILGYLGFEVDSENYTTVGGATRQRPKIVYNIGFTQGDYASFEGTWRADKMDYAALMQHAPQDELLHLVGAALMRCMLKYPDANAQISAQTENRNMQVDGFERDNSDPCDDVERAVLIAGRDLEKWLYLQYSEELLYRGRDDVVEQGIEAGDYEFNQDGSPV
jgi:hypothetical protein